MKRVYVAVLVLLAFFLLFLPPLAEARGGHGGGHGGGRGGRHCGHGKVHRGFRGGSRGGFYGGWYGGFYLAPPVNEAYPMCYETIPEHWESQWNPEVQGYVDVYVPEQIIAIPCP